MKNFNPYLFKKKLYRGEEDNPWPYKSTQDRKKQKSTDGRQTDIDRQTDRRVSTESHRSPGADRESAGTRETTQRPFTDLSICDLASRAKSMHACKDTERRNFSLTPLQRSSPMQRNRSAIHRQEDRQTERHRQIARQTDLGYIDGDYRASFGTCSRVCCGQILCLTNTWT